MSVTVPCSACQRSLKVRDEQLGKRAKCPGCGAMITLDPVYRVPLSPFESEPVEDEPLPELPGRPKKSKVTPAALMKQVLAAFDGEFQRPRVSLGYLAAMLVVAVSSAALVVTYVALVAATGYAVYWHAVTHTTWLALPAGTPGRARALVFLGYVLLILFGSIMVLFLLKPLVARSSRAKLGRKLELSDEPIVYSFVAKLAEVVGAPEPAEIRVNSSVNAAAVMGSGLLGLFSRRLVLVIGTPLAAGLDANQFAGVIAHELGHFSQGVGSRVSGFIRAIQNWLIQGAYGGDEWDEWFSDLTDDDTGIFVLFGLTCQFGAFLVRIIFFVLLVLSVLASFLLQRQMEYDADRYEALVVGVETFISTTKKLLPLSVAEMFARNMLINRDAPEPEEGHFAGLVLFLSKQMPKPLKTELRKHGESARTSWFSTHPSDADRIRNVERLAAPGLFHLDMPARQLFLHFDRVAKDTSPKSFKRMFPVEA
ncbi:MAG: M48 family metallopeptidase [Planctomycetaceae bacterium]|nr:M48 family metallopeptidase [Planctomycetaceae bacterium]